MRRRQKRMGSIPSDIAHPGGMFDFDPSKHGVLLAMASVGALVTLHRMARHSREGKYPLEQIEGVVTGMVLYGVLEAVRDQSREAMRPPPRRWVRR